VLAGHQYKVSNQRHHSIRNYLNAQEVIQDKGWKQAELHVNEIIGIHALQLGDKIKVILGWKSLNQKIASSKLTDNIFFRLNDISIRQYLFTVVKIQQLFKIIF